MNLYLHDAFVHAGIQYALFAGFRGFSAEEDEGLFASVKEIVADTTNHRDNISEAIMLRLATKRESNLDFGPTKNKKSHSEVSKAAAALAPRECRIPNRFAGDEDFETFIKVLRGIGFNEKWMRQEEDCQIFSTTKVPDDFGTIPSPILLKLR